MSVIIRSDETKLAIDAIESLFKTFLYPNMKPAEIAGVRTHLEWIKGQMETLLSIKLETVPQLQLTRITIETTHGNAIANGTRAN